MKSDARPLQQARGVMGPDGNVVLDDRGHAVWADGKTGYPNAYLAMGAGGGSTVSGAAPHQRR